MPNFRAAHKQAAYVVQQVLALGTARHAHGHDGQIHSIGTARAYQQVLSQAAQWLKTNGHMEGLHRMTPTLADAYLQERAEYVRQPALDLDRQALQTLPSMASLARVHSQLGRSALATGGRAYTPAQVQLITAAQTPRHALATQLAHAAGLRAHELFTLRPVAEQPASRHRLWSVTRFTGRADTVRYTVVGKGGLIREIAMPRPLAMQLEARRLPEPIPIVDRQVYYTQYYAVGGGKGWSASFRAASLRALEWSTGAHGLRHSYAQERMAELQHRGIDYPEALEVVSQEMGHFRSDITEVYLR
jgi:integrase